MTRPHPLIIRIPSAIKFSYCYNISVYIWAPLSGSERNQLDRRTIILLLWVCWCKGWCSPMRRGQVVNTDVWRIKRVVRLYTICIRLHGWRFGATGYFGWLPWSVDGSSGYMLELAFYLSRCCSRGTVMVYRWLLFLDCCLSWGYRWLLFLDCCLSGCCQFDQFILGDRSKTFLGYYSRRTKNIFWLHRWFYGTLGFDYCWQIMWNGTLRKFGYARKQAWGKPPSNFSASYIRKLALIAQT